ncbi:MAG: hypothetical protein HY951_04510 [Bacteroidia bacterium]|nr:hypothetical protein [Bacteroidia bacterium]
MKKLEKSEMKSINGGMEGGFTQECWDNFNGTSSCSIKYDNGYWCVGTYTYGGATRFLHCE